MAVSVSHQCWPVYLRGFFSVTLLFVCGVVNGKITVMGLGNCDHCTVLCTEKRTVSIEQSLNSCQHAVLTPPFTKQIWEKRRRKKKRGRRREERKEGRDEWE